MTTLHLPSEVLLRLFFMRPFYKNLPLNLETFCCSSFAFLNLLVCSKEINISDSWEITISKANGQSSTATNERPVSSSVFDTRDSYGQVCQANFPLSVCCLKFLRFNVWIRRLYWPDVHWPIITDLPLPQSCQTPELFSWSLKSCNESFKLAQRPVKLDVS